MRSVVLSGILLAVSLQSVAQISAAAPRDRLIAATQSSSLNDPDLKPWHLELDVTLYDADGKHPSTGTIETWRSGKKVRSVYTFGDAKRTILNIPNESYESHEGPEIPAIVDFIESEFLNPGPSMQEINSAHVELHQESFGKIKLDCIMLEQSIKHETPFPMGLFPTYCFDTGGDTLRASYNFGSYSVLRNGIGLFQGRQVATHISLVNNQITKADAKATIFSTFVPTADFFQPDPNLTMVHGSYARVAGGVIAGAILTKVQPVYPQSSKANHISGTVVLRAIIGRDGHIYYLRPVSAPDADLAISSIQAVRQWTYKPYLLNGRPTSVDTTITVNFNLN